ncbi:LuxR C-terminal-related transcriptional regulator [Streptomyces sp. NPDC057474]|uniref:helix-turn-helix transcriptional regulator n=1 Tax=Streptomyces sp. NPDC057474 TaxID=3346144 RepID=UPI003688ED4C
MFGDGDGDSVRRPSVVLLADDPLVQEGAAVYLDAHEQVELLPGDHVEQADIAVLIADEVTGETLSGLLAISRRTDGVTRIVLVTDDVDDEQLTLAVAYGVVSLLRRSEASFSRIVTAAVDGHRGRSQLPSSVVGRLASLMRGLQREDGPPRGVFPASLVPRELDVLRLLAEGLDTAEIAGKLSYSERSIKSIIHDLTKRLGLRNRTHAVAYAMRAGLL